MSYRDLRNFSEAMRALGFQRAISMDSFRNPNFPLVEEALRWLAMRAAESTLRGAGHSQDARVQLIAHAVELFHSRLNIRLNGRRLYGADGWAVRELLKVAAVLRAALKPTPAAPEVASYDVGSQLGDMKRARRLATEVTARGSLLFDLLAKEPEYKECRALALSRPMDMSALEGVLRRALASAAARAAATRERAEHAAAAASALDAKIERRRAELQRAEKRLHTVQKIKPAWQGELASLQQEVGRLWRAHVLRFRCAAALRHALSLLEAQRAQRLSSFVAQYLSFSDVDQQAGVIIFESLLSHCLQAAEEQQAAIMQLITKYEAEDVLGKLSESDEVDESSDEPKEASEAPPRPSTRPRTRLRIKTATGSSETRGAFGSVAAAAAQDSPDEDDTDLSDDDAFAVVEEPSASIADGLAGASGASGRWGRRPRPASRALRADDDFADLIEGADGASDSLGSSSESELRLGPRGSARASAGAQRMAAPLSDNEF